MLTVSCLKDNSTKNKRQKLIKKQKSGKRTRKNSKIVPETFDLDNPDVHDLMLVTHKKESEEFHSEHDFYSQSPSTNDETKSNIEYIRVPVIQVDIQHEPALNEAEFSIEEDTKNFLCQQILRNENEMSSGSQRLSQDEEDPLSLKESDILIDSGDQDIRSWIKNFTSLPLQNDKGRPYIKCPACNALFFAVASFKNHLLVHYHRNRGILFCSYCHFSTDYPNELLSHLHVHVNQCEVCLKNLNRKNSFEKHYGESRKTYKTKKMNGIFFCYICALQYDLKHQLRRHWFKHTCTEERAYQCMSCQAIFDTPQYLENHKCLRCPICDKSYDSFPSLRAHTRCEKHFLYCSVCSYEFSLRVDYERHLELHKKTYTLNKKYAYCLQAKDETSLQCELCGKIFHTESSFVLHINNDHNLQAGKSEIKTEDNERTMRPAAYEIMNLRREYIFEGVNLEEACGEVFEDVPEALKENLEETDDFECKPVSLCWKYPKNQLNVKETV